MTRSFIHLCPLPSVSPQKSIGKNRLCHTFTWCGCSWFHLFMHPGICISVAQVEGSLILTPLGTSACLGWFLSSLRSKISTTSNPLKSHFLGTSWYFALDLVFPWSTSQSAAHSPACTNLPVELRFINKMHTVLTLQTIDATSMIKKSAFANSSIKNSKSTCWNSGWFTIPHGKLLQSPLITSSILLFPLMPFNNLATLYLCPAFSLDFSSCTCDSRFQYKLGCSPSPLIVTIRNSMEFHVFWIPGSLKTFMFHYYCEGGQPEVQDSLFQYESAHISTKQTHKWQQKQTQKWPQKCKIQRKIRRN